MTAGDVHLILVSCAGIALAVLLIARLGLHPLVGLLCGAIVIALAGGLSPKDGAAAIEKGFGDILGSTGIVVALGLGLGTMLQITGGAQALARVTLGASGRHVALGSLAAALLLGLPLFFETGVVLLMPIVAAAIPDQADGGRARLTAMLSAAAGLSVLHALVPPHPGPLIAVNALGASLGKTLLLGAIVAVPTALVAGPLLARFTTRGVTMSAGDLLVAPRTDAASPLVALFVLLFPVLLIAAGAIVRMHGDAATGDATSWLLAVSDPVIALLLANLVALVLLFGRRLTDHALQAEMWNDAMRPAGSILLSIGAGGALKQVLVSIGLPAIFARLGEAGILPPLLLGWLVAAVIRVATGSATVATITAAGVMAGVTVHGVDAEYMVLAIGSGSIFLSHVNDPGFWMVRGYLGLTTVDTFRVWTTLETTVSLVGLALLLLLRAVLGAA
jgi:gluconate:H+ symporter, GntP family